MKRFYTFEPKNFRIFDKMKGFLAMALMLLMAVGNVNAQVYQLVTSASDLAVGDQIVIAASGYDYAMGTTQNSSNRAAVAITKTGNVATWTTSAQVITLEAGSAANTFALNVSGGYLCAASSTSNQLKTQSSIDGNSSWAISFTGGVANIVAQGTYARKVMQYNNTSSLFSCYSSATQKALCIYKSVCPEVTDLTAGTTTANSAQFTWNSTASEFQYQLNSLPATYSATQVDGVWTLTLTGLNPNTTYALGVKSTCASDYSTANATTICPDYSAINTINASIVDGDSYMFNGIGRTAAGTYTAPLTDAFGCDSTVTLNLTVVAAANINEESVSSCGAYTFHKFNGTDIICTETNIYYDTLAGAAQGGLDSIHILHLTVNPTYEMEVDVVKCQSELPFTFGTLTFGTNSPVMEYPVAFEQTFQSVNGCDSVVRMHLTINQSFTAAEERTICENELPYNWSGVSFTAAGTQNVTLTAANGCDSVVTMTLNVNMNTASTINAEIVENDLPYTLNGTDYNTTGSYTQTIANANGCDSVITLNLTVYANVAADVNQTICESELPYTWNGKVFDAAGSQSAVLAGQGAHGVDSTVNMTLAVNPIYNVTDEQTICDDALPYTWNGVQFTAAGTQTATLTTVNGCDSVVTMTLNVNNRSYEDAGIITICENELPYTWRDVIFTENVADSVYTIVRTNAVGCDSIITVNVKVNGTSSCTFNVAYEQPENGTIAGPTTVNFAENAEYVFTPASDCYYLESVTLDGADVLAQVVDNRLAIDSIVAHHTLAATYAIYSYTVTATQTENGTITATANYDCGTSPVYQITPNEGHHIVNVTVDGADQGAISSYQFNDIHADHAITATFAIDQFTITATAGANGSITPAGVATVDWHTTPSYTITPIACYEIATLTVNGTEIANPTSPYVLDEVEENVTIDVTFQLINFELTWENIGEGEGTVNGQPEGVFTTANCGDIVTNIPVHANTGSHIASVVWNNNPIVLGGSIQDWTINIPMSVNNTNTNVQVNFTPDQHIVGTAVNDDAMGTITPATNVVNYNTNASVTINSTVPGYHIEYVICGNDTVAYGNNSDTEVVYTVNNVTMDTVVEAVFAINTYTITVNNDANGNVVPATQTVEYGSDVTFTITPNDCYSVDVITLDGAVVSDPNLTNIDADHTVEVVFAVDEFTMTGAAHDASMGEVIGGTANCGQPFTYTVNANTGYHIDSVVVAGNVIATYTDQPVTVSPIIADVQNDMQLDAYFSLNNYTVVATADNGTITPANSTVAHGGSQTFTMLPNSCYELGTVTVNGTDMTSDVTSSLSGQVAILSQDFSAITNDNINITSNLSTLLPGWSGSNVYSNSGKVRFGTNNAKGVLTLPELNVTPGEFHIIFDAKAWNSATESTSFVVKVNGVATSVPGLSATDMNHFDLPMTATTDQVTISFEGKNATKSRVIMDNIVVTGLGVAYQLVVDPINENTNVVATFTQIEYPIVTSVAAGEGEITPSFNTACGEASVVTMTASEGSHIDSYSVNGTVTTLGSNSDVTAELHLNGLQSDTVVVTFATNVYNVTTLAATGQGSFAPATQTVEHGQNATVTVTADDANGYHIQNIFTSTENNVEYGANTDVTATFVVNNVVSDTLVKANFALNIYPITVTNNNPDHGNVVPTTTNWAWGQNASFTITPNTPCYYISEITVDGTTLVAGTDYNVTGDIYTFYNVVDQHTLVVDFTDSLFAMTASVHPTSSATVNTGDAHCGEDYTFHIEAAEGQHLSMVFVDGMLDTVFANQEDVYDVAFTDVHAAHSILVYTQIDNYTINVATTGEGTTNLDGNYSIVYGNSMDFTFTPDACQELSSLLINGEEHIADVVGNTYTFAPTADAQIEAIYSVIEYTMNATHNANGSVTTGVADCGSSYTFTMNANEGYHIASYTIGSTNITFTGNATTSTELVINPVSQDTTVVVDFAINTYNVNLCTAVGGTLTTTTPVVNHGDNCTVNVAADEVAGYHIQTITCGSDVVNYGANTDVTASYEISNIVSDTTICAAFELNNYTITASVTDDVNGSITPAGETAVRFGDEVTYTVRPTNDCHYITTVVVDGTDITVNDSVPYTYTFSAINDNHTIVANFTNYTYSVATSVNDVTLGTITDGATLNCGDTYNFTATPVTGQHIVAVTVDGVAQTIADSSLFTGSIDDIHADHTVDVVFGINNYTMIATAGANGNVTPAGTTVVAHGDNLIYTITPDDCYYISEILVDGADFAITDATGMDVTFANITEAHTIEANFAIYEYNMDATVNGNGTVSTATVNCGDAYSYTIVADLGWHIESYEFAGTTVYNTMAEPNDYNNETVTVSAARQDTMIVVNFAIDTYTVTACTAANGNLVVNDPVEVDSNSNTTVTVSANALNGYHIVSITDNRGGSVELGANTDIMYVYNVDNVDRDIEVCATFALNTFNITATAGANGTITPEGTATITYGETATYTIEPNHTCYYISAINVDGTNVWTGYTDSVSATTYTFDATTFDPSVVEHTITTEYTIFEYNMLSAAYNMSYDVVAGTVSSATVNCGTDYNYEINAATGYHIDHIVLDGTTTNYEGQQATDIVTISDVQAHHTLDAYFAINHYDIVATGTDNGTITPAGTTDVEHFSSLTYTIAADQPCYHIADVLVDGASVGAVETYTFSDIDGAHTIDAVFAINQYAMNENHTGNGTVTTAVVDCGTPYQYTITADNGWHIDNHTLGGVTYTLNHNTDVVAYRNVTAATQDTVLDVVFSRNLYTITVTSTGNGTTTPGTTTVAFEDDAAFTMTPAVGHHVADVLVDGASVGDATAYTFVSVDANHTLDVIYEADIFTINATAEANGNITVAGDNQVAYGESVNFTIVADPCYNISAVLVDGAADANFEAGQTVATYTMSNVDANHTVVAQFAINTYNVTVNAIGNGTVAPATGTYNCGDDVVLTFTPNEGAAVESVVVNGQNYGSMTTYTIGNIAADYTVDVTFVDNAYTLTAIAYNNGTITPAGATVVAENGSMTYTLTPDACQTVDNILVNGVSYLDSANFDGTTLTLNNITADMMIQAYFQVMTYNVEATQVEGGVITETGVYNCGTDVVYNITAADCYTLTDVTVDGASVGAVTTYTFSAIDADHTITATFTFNTYNVTATAGVGGTITASATFDCGETPTYVITPDEGYFVENVDVDGVAQGAIDSYTFAALNADHTIDATFAKYTYHVNAYANAGVTMTPAVADTIVEYGAELTYTITVDDCYDIADVTVDGESVGAVTTYTFSNITENHVIVVDGAIKTYTITATATEGGVIAPAGETTVDCGGSQFYSITPAVGYVISDVTVDGSSVGAVSSYSFTNVTADATIDVVFTAIADSTYTITATATGNGTITPAGATTVNYGASQTYTMEADEFYTIAEVLVDGVNVGAVATYTFANVTADHTIEVIFTEAVCATPSNAWTDNITETAATLNWTDMGATSYTVRYMKAGDEDYIEVANITTNTYDLAGLEEGTQYFWNVKSVCVEGTAESDWSSQQHFTTTSTVDTTGINDIDLSAMNVYSYGNDIYVVNNSNEQIKDVQVYDMNGRVIFRGMAESNPTVINVAAANGLYVVRVVTENNVRNYKVSISQR